MMSEETQFRCKNSDCTRLFPVINGVPVLLNESNSIFSIGDFICGKSTTFDLMKPKWKKNLHKLLPKISLNVKAKNNVLLVKRLLLNKSSHPRVLVVGGSIEGEGMSMLGADIETVSTDVSFGPLTELICDAHDLPFINQSFEGVVIQAVLEHVVDPYRCVEEVHRVLKSDGIVYAETPFMQQVHMGRYDFTRFTHLGHRRLFRKFFEIESGASCGTGMALISAIRGFLQSLTSRRLVQRCLRVMVSVTLFWLKYLDYLTIDKPATNDAASGLYFIGGKAQNTLSDRELLNEYKGAQ
ncbi:MAG: class I SAM-dependent methyltransferase [Deltaproteobacteria bacterium]